MSKPLEDVSVVEVAGYVAVPSAGAILADLGADVVRIEPLRGDPWRGQARRPKVADELRNYDYQFAVSNRGKRSIALDLSTDAGADLVQQLVARSQIFICNMLVHRQERLGLDPATLQAVNPTLVHGTLTGYGTTGPDAWRPGFDVTSFFARSGMMEAEREDVDSPPPMPRPGQGDHTAGLALLSAVLVALRQAERTGKGQIIETSLLEAAVWTLACDYAITAVDHAPVPHRARENAIIATNNRFPCGDGRWLVITMPGPANWAKLCLAIGRHEWLDEERYASPRDRLRLMPEIVAGIDAALASRSRDEWGEVFDREGIVWAPVQTLGEVVVDPQATALGLFCDIEGTEVGTIPSVRIPMQFHTADAGPAGPAPDIGQHTDEVLSDLGLDGAAIAKLEAEGVIRRG